MLRGRVQALLDRLKRWKRPGRMGVLPALEFETLVLRSPWAGPGLAWRPGW